MTSDFQLIFNYCRSWEVTWKNIPILQHGSKDVNNCHRQLKILQARKWWETNSVVFHKIKLTNHWRDVKVLSLCIVWKPNVLTRKCDMLTGFKIHIFIISILNRMNLFFHDIKYLKELSSIVLIKRNGTVRFFIYSIRIVTSQSSVTVLYRISENLSHIPMIFDNFL